MKKALKALICGTLSMLLMMTMVACGEKETDLSHLNKALLYPETVKLNTTEARGVMLEQFLWGIGVIEHDIEYLHLDSLEDSLKKGTYKDGIYECQAHGYEYKLGEYSLEIKSRGELIFSYTYNEKQKRIQNSVSHYLYEETDGGNSICLTIDGAFSRLTVLEDGYLIDGDECNWGEFQISQETYDLEWNFTKMKATGYDAEFIGYALPSNYMFDTSYSNPGIIDADGNKYKIYGYEDNDAEKVFYMTFECKWNNGNGQYFVFMKSDRQFPKDLQPITD